VIRDLAALIRNAWPGTREPRQRRRWPAQRIVLQHASQRASGSATLDLAKLMNV